MKSFHTLLYEVELPYICSAVLIANKFAIAAAGFVKPYENRPQQLRMMIGVGLPLELFDTNITHILIHPNYNPEYSFADIAILTVSSITKNVHRKNKFHKFYITVSYSLGYKLLLKNVFIFVTRIDSFIA